MNNCMRLFIPWLVTVFFVTYSQSEEFLEYPASQIVSVQGLTGSWRLGEKQVTVLANESKNIFSVSVPGMGAYTLREFCFVSQVASKPDRGLVIMKISRWRPEGIGSYFESLLRVSVDESGQGLSITECLSANYLRPFYNGNTAVRSIGDISKFPIVELEIGKALSPELPTKIVYVWELWNLKKRLPVDADPTSLPIQRKRNFEIQAK